MGPDIDVEVREVGLRDGLQSVSTFFPTAEKIAWVRAEAACGMPEIEVCSFVPPKLIPQFTDALEVVAASLEVPDVVIAALTPNLKGALRGFDTGVHKLNYVTSVSESHNQSNVRRSTAESVEDFRRIVEARDQHPEAAIHAPGRGPLHRLGLFHRGCRGSGCEHGSRPAFRRGRGRRDRPVRHRRLRESHRGKNIALPRGRRAQRRRGHRRALSRHAGPRARERVRRPRSRGTALRCHPRRTRRMPLRTQRHR